MRAIEDSALVGKEASDEDLGWGRSARFGDCSTTWGGGRTAVRPYAMPTVSGASLSHV